MDEVEYDYKQHFGVYGVLIEEGKLLCIRKNSGPYQNRYDLPGGSQESGEGLTETLVREVWEETGRTVSQYRYSRIYDTFVRPDESLSVTHHMFALYDILLEGTVSALPAVLSDGPNDSDGPVWVDLKQLNPSNASPLILKVLDEQSENPTILDKSCFDGWRINH